MNPEATIRKAEPGYEATFERRLRQPPARVWAMLAEPDRIASWYVRTELEPRVGGRMVEHHDHVGASGEGRVTRFEPPRLFEHTWWEGAAAPPDIIRWELFPDGDGTRLLLTHRFGSLAGAQAGLAGWHICLDVLGDVLEGADPQASAPPRGTLADGKFTMTQPGRGRWRQMEGLDAAYQARVAAFAP